MAPLVDRSSVMGARSSTLKAHGDDFVWSLLDATPDATLIVAISGEIVFVNDHAGELFGFMLDDLLGRVVEDLLPVAQVAGHRANRTRYRAEPTVRSMGGGLDLWARRSDGTEFPVEISLSPLRLGNDIFTVAAVRDITARVVSEDHLHWVFQTLDASDDAVFIFDAKSLRYSFVNEGAVRMVGYHRDELLTMTPLHLNPYATEDEYRNVVDSLLGDGTSSIVNRRTLLRKDGTEVPVEKTLHAAPVGRDGQSWIIALARDITARLEAEAELTNSHDQVRQAELAAAIADDRERIARDLHDTVIQRLFGEGLHLEATMRSSDERTRRRLQSTVDGLDQTIKEIRMTVFSLQGGGLAERGIHA